MSKFSKEKEDFIVQMYLYGVNQVEIADYFKTFNTSIRRVLQRNNIQIRSNTEIQGSVSSDFFNDYSNKDIQYWLGVIASDGCLTSGKLVVETKDEDWMESFRDFVNPSINILTTQPKKGNTLYRVQFRCKGLKENLSKYGLSEKKSLNLYWKYPITKDFLRGVFDGDGCLTYTEKTTNIKVAFCGGSLLFLEQIRAFLEENNIKSKIYSSTQKNRNVLHYLFIHNDLDKEKFYNLIYKDSNYFLKRKRVKFANWINNTFK